MCYTYVPIFILISLIGRVELAEIPTFCHFWTSAFCGVDIWQSTKKVECGCTATNLPISNGIEILYVLQCLQGEIVHSNFVDHKCDLTSVTDKQTNRQKTQS